MSQPPYKIVEERRATKHKNALDKTIRERVERRLEKLADNPRPADSVALAARTGVWRVRTGDYRILYEIDNARFPAPAYELRAGHLWLRAAIEAFDARWERKPGRPRKVQAAAG